MIDMAAYSAPCVRACALRAGLLKPDEWRLLDSTGSAADAIAWLQQRGVLAESVDNVVSAERAMHKNMIRNTVALLRFARKDLSALLKFFVQYYDLLNFQSAIRRVHAGEKSGRQSCELYDTGTFGMFSAQGLESATNFAALAGVARNSILAKPFNAALLNYHESEDAARLVEAVEMAFLKQWVKVAGRCGFHIGMLNDRSGLSAFLVTRVIEAVIRLKFHRGAERGRIVEWLQIVAKGRGMTECLAAIDCDNENEAYWNLARVLLPGSFVPDVKPEGGGYTCLRMLHACVLKRVTQVTRGLSFSADFLVSFLLLHLSQIREFTILLESKESGLTSVRSLYLEASK